MSVTPEQRAEWRRLAEEATPRVLGVAARTAIPALLDYVERLEAALASAPTCRSCRGTGVYRYPCGRCGDSTYDHACNDDEEPCGACQEYRRARAALDGDTPCP